MAASSLPTSPGLAVSALLWLGLLLGVSFLATPAKFLAPSLSLPVALDVGRATFAVFSYVEIVAAVAVLAFAALDAKDRAVLLGAVLLAAVVATQVLWLLPLLDARVETILRGGTPDPARFHDLYVLLEASKAALLAAVAWRSLPRRGSPATA